MTLMNHKHRKLKICFLLILLCNFIPSESDGNSLRKWGHPKFVNPLPDTSFVKSDETFILCCGDEDKAWGYYNLDGKLQRRLFDGKYRIKDVSADGQVFALSNMDSQLFISRDGGKTIVEVLEFRKRGVNLVQISPTGKYLIVMKFHNRYVPDTEKIKIEVLDTQTLKFTASFFTTKNWRARWLDDEYFEFKDYADESSVNLVNAESGEVVPLPSKPKLNSKIDLWKKHKLPTPAECGMKFDWEDNNNILSLKIIDSNQNSLSLLTVIDYAPGYSQGPDGEFKFPWIQVWVSRDCRFLIINNEQELWVAEVGKGKVGPMVPKHYALFHRWGWDNLGNYSRRSELDPYGRY